MKQFLLLFTALLIISNINAQLSIINEGFENNIPQDWNIYNQDGDDKEWEIINMSFWAMTGNRAISLESTTGANDWLVSSQIYLQQNYILSFYATEIYEGVEENISVWISTTGNTPADFTTKLEDITVPYLGSDDDGFLYTEYRIDLTSYKEQNVYIAWQLNSPTNSNGLCLIDNISTEYTEENIEWSKILLGEYNHAVCLNSDATYVIAGSYQNEALFLQKNTTKGAQEWLTTTVGTLGNDYAHSVAQTFDELNNPSGFIVTGYMNKNPGMLTWILKYDINGELEWTKEFGVNGDQNEGFSIVQTNDGGYIVTGYENTGYRIILIKLDKDGNQVWIEKFGNGQLNFGSEVIQTADGGYAITGYYSQPEPSICLIKTDKNGTQEYLKIFSDIDNASANALVQTTDEGFMIAGFAHDSQKDWRIIKTDKYGEIEWEKTFGNNEDDIPNSIIQTAEGNFLIAGYKKVNSNRTMWIIKIDQTGEIIWDNLFDISSNYVNIEEIAQTQDGGYLFTGYTINFFSDTHDGLTVKIKSDETELSNNDIIKLYLPEQTEDAVIDSENHTVVITVSNETNITELTPQIMTSPQSTVFPKTATTHDFSQDFIYTVTALDQTPQEWTITVEGGTTSVENQIENNFSIYPNPSNGIFTISYLSAFTKPESVEITDLTGKKIQNIQYSIFNNQYSIKEKGIYFIKINTKTGIYTEKLIIQ